MAKKKLNLVGTVTATSLWVVSLAVAFAMVNGTIPLPYVPMLGVIAGWVIIVVDVFGGIVAGWKFLKNLM